MHLLAPAIILTRKVSNSGQKNTSQYSELRGRTIEHGMCVYIAENDGIYNG
jgi:hypothetical protein